MIPSTTKNQIGALFNELLKLYPDLARMSEFENLYCRDYRDGCVFYIRYSGESDDCFTFGYESIIIGNCIKLLPGYHWESNDHGTNTIEYHVSRFDNGITREISNNLCLALLLALKNKVN